MNRIFWASTVDTSMGPIWFPTNNHPVCIKYYKDTFRRNWWLILDGNTGRVLSRHRSFEYAKRKARHIIKEWDQ